MENVHEKIKEDIDNLMREHLKKMEMSTLDALLLVCYSHILAVVAIQKSGINFHETIKDSVRDGDINYVMYMAAQVCVPLVAANDSIKEQMGKKGPENG